MPSSKTGRCACTPTGRSRGARARRRPQRWVGEGPRDGRSHHEDDGGDDHQVDPGSGRRPGREPGAGASEASHVRWCVPLRSVVLPTDRLPRTAGPDGSRYGAAMGLGWKLHGDGATVSSSTIVAPDERLSWGRTIGLGVQHVVAMFGATFLVPLITGFPPSTTLLFSGVGTILFLLITGNGCRATSARRSRSSPRSAPRRRSAASRSRCPGSSWSASCSPSSARSCTWRGRVDRPPDAPGGVGRDRRADRLQPRAGRP